MSRPKGSKNKVKPKETAYTTSLLEPLVEVMEDVELAKKKIAQLKQKPVQVHGKRVDVDTIPETPLPSDWASLGKVAKLQWLTANRKK